MNHGSASRARIPPSARPELLGWLLLLAGAAWLAIWLWSRICLFPENAWNDVRLAPTIALSRGLPVYPAGANGVISTWTYGPLPLLCFWPATWSSTAAAAIQVAAVVNFLLIVVPLAAVCQGWPANGGRQSGWARTTAFLLCVGLWPQRSFDYHQPDNLVIACALLGNLVLVRATRWHHYWMAAALAVGAIACKQIALGVPAAQLTWLAIVAGPRAASRHALRCVTVGLLLAAALAAIFSPRGLWFVLVQLPAHFPWAKGIAAWLCDRAPQLAWQLGMPGIVMLVWRRCFRQPELLLPALAWAWAVPLGMAALLKHGGDLNSLYSLPLWLPPVLTVGLDALTRQGWRASVWVVSTAVAVLAMSRVLSASRMSFRPQVDSYRSGARIARAYPDRVWFPWNPLITLYSDGRYYHDEDGLFVRLACGLPMTAEQLRAHLPRDFAVIAYRDNWMDWGVARRFLPAHAKGQIVQNWTLWTGEKGPPRDASP